MFSKEDISQFKAKGISIAAIEKQINNFKKGFPKLKLTKPATLNDGLLDIKDDELNFYLDLYNQSFYNKTSLKFVPASGAASRMFKCLYDFINTYQNTEDEYLKFLSQKGSETMNTFFEKLEDFAFYSDLKNTIVENDMNLDKMLEKKQLKEILSYLLTRKGLNYGNLPKGLLKFHRYKQFSRTAFEEHLIEALSYAKDQKRNANLHLTVSEEHMQLFKDRFDKTKETFEEKYEGKLNVSFSVQKTSTDTIAVTTENEPFKNEDSSILFRPGGHGALIENLNELNADIIFIKNIDNVVPDRLKETTHQYKKVLAGVLIEYQNKIFNYLKILHDNRKIDHDELKTMLNFLEDQLCVITPKSIDTTNSNILKNYLLQKFNRPIRVCGMVKNEGEPGGGPFWSINKDGSISLQIVEGSQIDKKDEKQNNILKASTHFNPVDLVCGIKDYKGDKFNLTHFIDKQTGFISEKSHNGFNLKAMELPGLWNGAMSDWNTIFVEVPNITFNPVKTVFDLLRIEHRNQ